MLIGATSKMGVGTNVQDRAVAPQTSTARGGPPTWPNGTAARCGNQSAEIGMFRHVVEGTFDAYMRKVCAPHGCVFLDELLDIADDRCDLGRWLAGFL